MPLSSAYPKLVKDCHDVLLDAFKATFVFGATDYSDIIAEKFASTGGPKLAAAIHNYVTQAQVQATVSPGQAVTVACPAGTGATVAPGTATGNLL